MTDTQKYYLNTVLIRNVKTCNFLRIHKDSKLLIAREYHITGKFIQNNQHQNVK